MLSVLSITSVILILTLSCTNAHLEGPNVCTRQET